MAWVSKSRQGNCKNKVLRRSIPVPSSNDIPPGVARARERVGWNETSVEPEPLSLSSQVVLGSVNVNAVAVKSETSPRNPVLEPLFLRTEAGEVLKRQRVNGPWFPLQTNSGQFRGSARLALDIASSSERTDLAVNQFETLIYNSSTVASKESYFNLWTSICHALKFPPLPVTKDSLIQVAAILRAAGYRAAMTYVYEARSRHIRAGFAWPSSLDSVVADCRRASKRALGPASRAEEIRLVWWKELQRKVGCDPCENEASEEGPAGGIKVWVFCTQFLLREVEASALTLDTACVKLDEERQVISLHLSVQKNDPSAKGAWRSLSCACKREGIELCPFHVGKDLVRMQLLRLDVSDLRECPVDSFPLIARRCNPRMFVEKTRFIAEAQRFACMLKLHVEPAACLDVEKVLGHSFRRSGAKDLARKGLPFQSIQWMARHSSNTTWVYVEEAWEEAPRQDMKLQDTMSLCELVSDVIARVDDSELALKALEQQIISDAGLIEPSLWSEEGKLLLRSEIRKVMVPIKIGNLTSRKLHDVCEASCLLKDPKQWSTKGGWRWAFAHRTSQPYFQFDDLPEDFVHCEKCSEP